MKNIIEISVEVHWRTEAAIRVSDDGNEDNAQWVPISQIENWDEFSENLKKGNVITIEIPEWLAHEKEFI